MDGIERKFLRQGDRLNIEANRGHRIIRERGRVYLEVSSNGQEGFMHFSVPVTYYRFSGTAVGRSPVPNMELERYGQNSF